MTAVGNPEAVKRENAAREEQRAVAEKQRAEAHRQRQLEKQRCEASLGLSTWNRRSWLVARCCGNDGVELVLQILLPRQS